MNALPDIPSGAYLIGRMGHNVGAEPERTYRGRLKRRVADLAVKTLPGLQDAFDILQSVTPESVVLTAIGFILSDEGPIEPSRAVQSLEYACGNLGFREFDQQGRLQREKNQAFTQRIFMGLFGGIALICPVLIMVLHPSQNTNLITVSVATSLFAVVLAIGASDRTGKDVLAATAAYTAVLVVFFRPSGSSG